MIPTMITMRTKIVTIVISLAQKEWVSNSKLRRGVLLSWALIPHIFKLYLFASFKYFIVFTPLDTEVRIYLEWQIEKEEARKQGQQRYVSSKFLGPFVLQWQ